MNRLPDYFDLARYAIAPADVVRLALGCRPEDVQPLVVITPVWENPFRSIVGTGMTEIVAGRVFQVEFGRRLVTFIRSGIGAPLTGDVVLALGCTPCRTLMFTGSAGGLIQSMQVGDVVLVERTISGDGFSRYMSANEVPPDTYGQPAYPDGQLTAALAERAAAACARDSVTLHRGRVFAIDTIIGQFGKLPHITGKLGCIAIEMETAATFNAARLVGIRAAALLQLSDVIPAKKSLFSGRTAADGDRRRSVRYNTLARVVLETLVETSDS